MPPVGISGVEQIAIRVTDVPRAVAFYRDVLELAPLPIPAPPSMAFFACGDVRLMLSTAEDPEHDHPGSILYLRVADIEAAHRTMRERGAAFLDAPHLVAKLPDGELWMTFFKDPDGNTMAITARKSG